MSLKDFMLRKMVQSQMKGVPQEEQEKIITIIQKNPELFQKIGTEVQHAVNGGKDQMSAIKFVLEKYKTELSALK